MSTCSLGSVATLTGSIALLAIGCAQSESLDLNSGSTGAGGDQTSDGSATPSGDGGSVSQGSGAAAGASGGIGSGGINGAGGVGAIGLGGSAGAAGSPGRGAGGGAPGQAGGSGHGGGAGTAGGGHGGAGIAGGGHGGAGTAGGGHGGGPGTAGGQAGHAGAAAAPTFTDIYNKILIVYCGGSSCHLPGSQHGVGFSTQAGAFKSLSSVAIIPGDSQGSTFYTSVATGEMPDGKPMLSSAFIDEIGAWIDAGALNN
jgi:hypothetical protein